MSKMLTTAIIIVILSFSNMLGMQHNVEQPLQNELIAAAMKYESMNVKFATISKKQSMLLTECNAQCIAILNNQQLENNDKLKKLNTLETNFKTLFKAFLFELDNNGDVLQHEVKLCLTFKFALVGLVQNFYQQAKAQEEEEEEEEENIPFADFLDFQ